MCIVQAGGGGPLQILFSKGPFAFDKYHQSTAINDMLKPTSWCRFCKLFDAVINFWLVVNRQKSFPPINNRYMHRGGFKDVHKCFARVEERATKRKVDIKAAQSGAEGKRGGWHARKALMAH